ncbi:arginine/serine-rich coiled-coil protein 2-like [Zophobas morio]|jgi:hypothetical protein|uniref:arginine/serine-rich coiled-coil protein 2-like n=1 Tax=Zophobas morio TaxID=2755281 RepID=UPI0030828CAF
MPHSGREDPSIIAESEVRKEIRSKSDCEEEADNDVGNLKNVLDSNSNRERSSRNNHSKNLSKNSRGSGSEIKTLDEEVKRDKRRGRSKDRTRKGRDKSISSNRSESQSRSASSGKRQKASHHKEKGYSASGRTGKRSRSKRKYDSPYRSSSRRRYKDKRNSSRSRSRDRWHRSRYDSERSKVEKRSQDKAKYAKDSKSSPSKHQSFMKSSKPNFYNNVAQRNEKRKLLWAKKEASQTGSFNQWEATQFDDDAGSKKAKFLKLMGSKVSPSASNQIALTSSNKLYSATNNSLTVNEDLEKQFESSTRRLYLGSSGLGN